MTDARALGAVAAALLTTTIAMRSALAQPPQRTECVRSYETAQEDRLRNDLLSARSRLLECSDACPSPFREQCAAWRAEIEKYLSSVRVRVVDRAGQAQAIQSAHVDARPFDPSQEVMLVPGEHALHVEVGDRALDKRIVTRAEQHGVVVELVLDPQPSSAPALGPAEPRSKVPAVVAFSAGGASLVTALTLAVYGHARRAELASSCKPTCDDASVDAIARAWWVAGGLGVVGAAGVVAGVLLWPSPRTTVTASPGRVAFELTF